MGWFAVKLAFAGLGHLVAHWSIGLIIIAACMVLEFGASFIETEIPIIKPFVEWVQKYILFVAIATALILLGEWLGAKDMATRCDAKAEVVQKQVDKAVTKSKIPKTGMSKFEDDNL